MSRLNQKAPLYLTEEQIIEHITPEHVQEVVEHAFVAMAKEKARNFPVVREQLGYADAVYGFKSGFDSTGPLLGVKAGGYWPGNVTKGLANHQSTVILFDPDTGQLKALVSGNHLTALRTAAAAAISVKYLAREDSKVLGVIGAGKQSEFQIRAAFRLRNFNKILIANRTREKAEMLQAKLGNLGVDVDVAPAEVVAGSSDVLITVVSAFEPQFTAEAVKPGTHIACMGTDTKGKQEVDAPLVAKARVFTDEVAQAITIGECQHAYTSSLIDAKDIVPIGLVIDGVSKGRISGADITLFDSTGVGLQDLVAAELAIKMIR